jgi:GH24 family phage-related lysozyme (muramidase)
MGQKRSLSDCQKQLIQSAGEHAKALVGLPESIPDVVLLGSLDMAYNVGVSGFSNSAVKRKLAQADYQAAGQAVLQWKYITLNGKEYDCSIKGNKVCYGLWKRRLWQSKAIGNEFKSVQEAVAALPK